MLHSKAFQQNLCYKYTPMQAVYACLTYSIIFSFEHQVPKLASVSILAFLLSEQFIVHQFSLFAVLSVLTVFTPVCSHPSCQYAIQ